MRPWLVRLAVPAFLLVAADVRAACTISATGVTFGTYDVFNAALVDSTGTITARCTAFTGAISVHLSTGQSGAFVQRHMRRSGVSLPYNLYREASRTSIWGNGTGGSSTYSYTPNFLESLVGFERVVTIFGRIFAAADVPAGTYTDTITATVNF